jgi:hypothetical protein
MFEGQIRFAACGPAMEVTMSVGKNRGVWLVIGVLVGLFFGSMAPNAPLHASATHGEESFALATGEVEMGLEGVFFLDMVTGELTGYVINPNTRKFTTRYKHNILKDMGEISKPRFLMVTGNADLRQGAQGGVRIGRSLVYIAEMNSGKFLAYAVPWVPARAATNTPTDAPFVLLDGGVFRNAPVRQ